MLLQEQDAAPRGEASASHNPTAKSLILDRWDVAD